MAVHIVFCSARDSNVPLVPRSPDWTWHTVLDQQPHGAVRCLDRGRTCTGTLCPFCADAADDIAGKEASGLGTEQPN